MSPDSDTDKDGGGKAEGIGGAVLIVNNNALANDAICEVVGKELCVDEEDVLVIENAGSALNTLKTIAQIRRQIRLLIVQERLEGRKFIDTLRTEVFAGEQMPTMITNDSIENQPGSPPIFADHSSALSKIQTLLREKPDFLKDILAKLNVLIVTQTQETRAQIRKALECEGVIAGNIVTAENPDQGLTKILDGIEHEVHSGSDVTRRREEISLLIMDEGQGQHFAELVQQKGNVYPYIVVLSEDGPDIAKKWPETTCDQSNVLSLTYGEFDTTAIDQIGESADLLHKAQLLSEAEARRRAGASETHVAATPSSDSAPDPVAVAAPDDAQPLIITPGAGETYFNFYREAKKLPTLVRHSDFERNMALNTEQIHGNAVCSFDMDGTLITAYVMGRFAQFLCGNENLDAITEGLLPTEKRKKFKLLRNLMGIIEFITKSAEQRARVKNRAFDDFKDRPYEEILGVLNNSYAELMEGLPVDIVCKKGHQFSMADFDQHAMPYAKPAIDMIHSLGMMGTLLTGMPAEVISGYREKLGIKERCYPLELRTKMVGEKMLFDKQVVFKGGTADEKQKVASSIAAGGHNELFFHMGDQVSDIGVMTVAMDTLERACMAQGKGFFMISPNSKEGHALIEEINQGHSRIYKNGRLVLVDRGLKTFVILEKVLDELLGIVHIRDGRRGIRKPEDSDELRQKLESLTSNRFEELQRFYK